MVVSKIIFYLLQDGCSYEQLLSPMDLQVVTTPDEVTL